MNSKTTYEQLIADKFEQRSVPNLADAIWLRINEQLDTELPGDDGNTPAPVTPGIGPGFWTGIAGVVLFAVVATFIFKKQEPAEKPVPPTPVQTTTPYIAPKQNTPIPAKRKPASVKVVPQPDTVQQQTPVVAPSPDTITHLPPPIVAPPPPPVIKDTIKKRSRGVTGITGDDYRIVPKGSSKKRP